MQVRLFEVKILLSNAFKLGWMILNVMDELYKNVQTVQ